LEASETEQDFETRYEDEFQIEFPVMMGLATREEMNQMTVNEVKYKNYLAKQLYKLQHPDLMEED
jgi:hypothetical protein